MIPKIQKNIRKEKKSSSSNHKQRRRQRRWKKRKIAEKSDLEGENQYRDDPKDSLIRVDEAEGCVSPKRQSNDDAAHEAPEETEIRDVPREISVNAATKKAKRKLYHGCPNKTN